MNRSQLVSDVNSASQREKCIDRERQNGWKLVALRGRYTGATWALHRRYAGKAVMPTSHSLTDGVIAVTP